MDGLKTGFRMKVDKQVSKHSDPSHALLMELSN